MARAAMDDNRIRASLPVVPDPGCGDFPMRIARDGTWFYQGSPIGRKKLVKLFSTVLRREADGSFWLVTPVERCRIAVDDAPFLAVEMRVSGSGRAQKLRFRTNVDDEVTAGAMHPIRVREDERTREPSPYVLIRAGLEALIGRAVFYDLVELAEIATIDGRASLGVWSDGAFFTLGAA
jgi:uncharacterized protein